MKSQGNQEKQPTRAEIMRAERADQKANKKKQVEVRKKMRLTSEIEKTILEICLNNEYMKAIQNQNVQYTAPDGTKRRGIILLSGEIQTAKAVLTIEPVNDTVNIYIRGIDGKHAFNLHWSLNKLNNYFIPDHQTLELKAYLNTDSFLGKTTPRSLNRQHGISAFRKLQKRIKSKKSY